MSVNVISYVFYRHINTYTRLPLLYALRHISQLYSFKVFDKIW